MSLFTELFAGAAADALLRVHGESLTYYPGGAAAAAPRSIVGIVDRMPYQAPPELGGQTLVMLRVRVLPNATNGISPAEVNAGADEIALKLRVNDASPTTLRIVGQPELNGGMCRLAVS